MIEIKFNYNVQSVNIIMYCIDVNTFCYRSVTIPRIGLTMSIPLYTRRPAKFDLVQAIAGIQMWRSGASIKVGLCSVSKNSSRFYIMLITNRVGKFLPCMV